MTIDEAIVKYKEITNTDAICPAHCNISCDKCVDESKHLAEWLKELKKYKENEFNVLKEDGQLLYKQGILDGYDKALDDFVGKVELKYLGVHPDEMYEKYYPSDICKQIKEIAAQLKAGGENES